MNHGTTTAAATLLRRARRRVSRKDATAAVFRTAAAALTPQRRVAEGIGRHLRRSARWAHHGGGGKSRGGRGGPGRVSPSSDGCRRLRGQAPRGRADMTPPPDRGANRRRRSGKEPVGVFEGRRSAGGAWRSLLPESFLPDPHLPGGHHRLFDRTVLSSLAWRVPPFLLLSYVLVLSADADLHSYSPCPLRIYAALGPSMLPTILPLGDVCISDAMSHRLPGHWRREWREGDVVVFVDYKGHMVCKRIVGLGGKSVRRYGEFVELFRDEEDWGVRDPELGRRGPRGSGGGGILAFPHPSSWDDGGSHSEKKMMGARSWEEEMLRTITVPDGHVWLEGDSPELSIDSRHYGPVPTSRLRGRIVARVWPLRRREREGSLFFLRIRPRPVSVDNLIRDERYNLRALQRQP